MAGMRRYEMEKETQRVVSVSRRIGAPPELIFAVVTDPSRHSEFDGSKMLQGSDSRLALSKVGDTFLMRMRMPVHGDYVMVNVVVDYELNRRIAWEPRPGDQAAATISGLPIGAEQGYRWIFELTPDGSDATVVTERFDCTDASAEVRDAVHDGENWLEGIAESLRRLDELCTQTTQ